MRATRLRIALIGTLTLLVGCPALTGCGGGGDNGAATSVAVSANPPGQGSGKQQAAVRRAQQFLQGGGDSLRRYGAEGSGAELRAAAAALDGFLAARAAHHWAAACTHLSPKIVASLGELETGGKKSGAVCASGLAALYGRRSAADLRQAGVAKPLSLRASGRRAYLIYEDARGTVFAIPMAMEAGGWRVGGLSGLQLE